MKRRASGSCPAQMPTAPYKRRSKSREPLAGRLGLSTDHPGASGARSPDESQAVPLSLASGAGHKTGEKCVRGGRAAGESAQPPGRGVAPRPSALCLHGRTTDATSVGRQVGAVGPGTFGNMVARLGAAQGGDRTPDDRCLVWARGGLGGLSAGLGGTPAQEETLTAASRGDRPPLARG